MLEIAHHIPLIGASVWVFVHVLTQSGQVFAFWGRFLEIVYNSKFRLLAKPLGYCGQCMSGQVGFWAYSALSWGDYNWVNHVYFTSITIISFTIIEKWLKPK